MVAVVGRPAERELREIPRPDDEAVFRVRDVHQNLRALAGLRVFIHDGPVFGIVPDVAEVHVDRLLDIDRREPHAVGLREHFGV